MKKYRKLILVLLILSMQFSLITRAEDDERDPQEPNVEFRNHEKVIYTSDEQAKEINDIEVWKAPKRYNTARRWVIPPTIFKTSDAVKPGSIFHLYGDGFMAKDMKIAVRIADNAIPQEKPPADCIMLFPIQLDPEIKYVSAQLPSDMPAGVYDVWVSNKYGWSYPVRLNAAKYEWNMEVEMAQGMVATAYGKNFDGAEFGSKTDVKVVLSNGKKTYEVPVISVNPYRIEYYIPNDLPADTYQVYISNNGGIVWSDVEICQVDQSLIVHESFDDKFELGLGWANQFNYNLVISVKENGAKADGETDDSTAIQKTIDAVKEQGGGIAYIPEGYYFVGNNLRIPAGVILAGDGQKKTILYYDYQGEKTWEQTFIAPKDDGRTEGRIGIYGFTIKTSMDPEKDMPDTFINFGDPWGEQRVFGARTTKYMFIKDICIDSKIVHRGQGRMLGITIVGDSHYLLEGCNFKGSRTSQGFSYLNYFAIMRHNDWYTATGNLHNAGILQTFLDNKMVRHHELAPNQNDNTQGIFMRGPAYVSENYIENTGKPGSNDGELVCSEVAGGGTKFVGDVISATSNTVTIDFEVIKDWDFNTILWGRYFQLVVVYGRGQGQTAYITKVDEATKTLTLDREWDIMPDSTSKVIAVVTSTNCYIYKNVANKGSKGYWLYGDCFDSVISDNIGTNVEGAFIYTCLKDIDPEKPNDLRLNVDYFNRITRNTFIGSGTKTNIAGIYVTSNVMNLEKPPARITSIFGTVINDNVVKDANKEYTPDNSEAPDYNGINIVHNLYKPANKGYIATKAIIIENNTIINSTNGISLGGYTYVGRDDWLENSKLPITQGVIMKGNSYHDVTIPFRESGVNGLKVLD